MVTLKKSSWRLRTERAITARHRKTGDPRGIRRPFFSDANRKKSADGLLVVPHLLNKAKIKKYGTIVKVFLQSF